MHSADRATLDWFVRTRDKTIELARGIPDDMLSRHIEGEIDHPLGVLFHVARAVDWWMGKTIRDGKPENVKYDTDREGVIDALHRTEERLLDFLADEEFGPVRLSTAYTMHVGETRAREIAAGGTPDWIGREWVHYITSHEIHHRAKVVLALRTWGFGEFPFFP